MARDIYRGQRTPGNPNLNNWAKERELLTPEQIEQAKYVGFWHLPDETRRVEPGGWWGGRNWNRERFCRTLYTVLYKAADGFLRPATLLERIWDEYGLNGNEVARRSGYGCFELMLKHRDFAKEVHYERVGMERGYNNLYVYHAAWSKEYECLRRSLPTPVNKSYGPNCCPELYTVQNEFTASRERARQEKLDKKAADEHRLAYGDSDPATDHFELLWANEWTTGAPSGDGSSRNDEREGVDADAIAIKQEGGQEEDSEQGEGHDFC